MPTVTKNIITRAEALKLAPAYVEFIEATGMNCFDKLDAFEPAFRAMKRGHKAITFTNNKYVKVKVTSVNSNDFRAEDGPVVRVGNDEFTWRVDGDKYAYPI